MPHPLNPPPKLAVRAAKEELRQLASARRGGVSAGERRRRDAQRNHYLIQALSDADTVACYLSTGSEPGTLDLVNQLFLNGARVLVPALKQRRSPTWTPFTGLGDLQPGLWGIPEPGHVVETELDLASVVLCSALAVTRDGWRLGVGGGWYDRALTSKNQDASVWALVDDADVVADLPREPHDLRIDAVATESGIVHCSAERPPIDVQ